MFNTNQLNKYWSVTERAVEEDHIIKRKQETVVNQLIIPERVISQSGYTFIKIGFNDYFL